MRLNVPLLVLAFAAATGVVGVPVTINDGTSSASSHQLVRRGWFTGTWNFLKKFVPPKSITVEHIVGIGLLTSLPTAPFVWLAGRNQEREDIQDAISERKRKAYEKEENEKFVESQNGTSSDEDPQGSDDDEALSQSQLSPNENSQGKVNGQESQVELRDPPTNYLPPSGPIRSGVFDESDSTQQNTESSPDASSLSSSNPDSDRVSLAGESQNNGLEGEANASRTLAAADDQQETRERSIEDVLVEDDTA